MKTLDRFTRGLIVGVTTSAIKDALSFFSYYVLHFTKATYGHLMAVFLYGRAPRSIFELLIAQFVELGIEGALGITFIYYAYRTKNKKNLWLKGIFFAYTVYLGAYFTGTFYRLPLIGKPAIETVICNFITTTIFGILMGAMTYWWGKKLGDFSDEVPQQNAIHSLREMETEDDVKPSKPVKLK